MGLLDRLLGRAEPTTLADPNTAPNWRASDDWAHAWGAPRNLIAGEQQCQRDLRRLAGCKGRCLRLVDVIFVPEPNNPVDPNAVLATVDRVKVGYLRAELAGGLASVCAENRVRVPQFAVAGVMRGGWDDGGAPGMIGVHVWLDRLLSPGPAIRVDDAYGYMVSWPPHHEELAVLRR